MLANNCVIFDVDGVLIDTRLSYNKAIVKSVGYIVANLKPALSYEITSEMIYKLRQTGMFNNDIDTAYALLLSIICKPPDGPNLSNYISEIATKASKDGIHSVEEYLSSFDSKQVKFLKSKLKYPNKVNTSIVTRIFDEYFYGPHLFAIKNGTSAKYYLGKPLIDSDRLIITEIALRKFSDIFSGRLAVLTGRSKLATQYSLGKLYSKFDPEASIYLEDEKRNLGKPSPYALKRVLDVFSCYGGLYVGDSAEDLIMAKNLNNIHNYHINFIGVYGSAAHPKMTKEYFLKQGYPVVKNVNELSNILYKVEYKF